MLRRSAPKYPGTSGCTGSGIRLGLSAVAATERLERVSARRLINPPPVRSRGIVINRQDQHCCNERAYGAHLDIEMGAHDNRHAWLIAAKTRRRATVA